MRSNDIVVVNEFTSGGSRGNTPGRYVLRYMARPGATEAIVPMTPLPDVREDWRFAERGRRSMATDATDPTKPGRKRLAAVMDRVYGLGGVAFGRGMVEDVSGVRRLVSGLSLTDADVRDMSRDIQRLYDEGHTVMKTVVSFSDDWLRLRGIVPADATASKPGDWRGKVDQLRLRDAIDSALRTVAPDAGWDDPRWVGVIQVDARHVHCHLAIVDAGHGVIMPDGTQRGRIPVPVLRSLKGRIDERAKSTVNVPWMPAAGPWDSRSVDGWVDAWAAKAIAAQDDAQQLAAALPADPSVWDAASRDPDMAQANRLCRGFVLRRVREGWPQWDAAMAQVSAWAQGDRALAARGREVLVTAAMNGVYRAMPHDGSVRTRMLDDMTLDYPVAVATAENGLDDMCVRLRRTKGRMDAHSRERRRFARLEASYRESKRQGLAQPGSDVLYKWYLEEEEYHAKAAAKYRSLLPWVPGDDDWDPDAQWEAVEQADEAVRAMEGMYADETLRNFTDSSAAEAYGLDVWGRSGAHLLVGSSAQRAKGAATFRRLVDDGRGRARDARRMFRADAAAHGWRVTYGADGSATWERGAEYPFDEVRAIDLHDMLHDNRTPIPVSRDAFVDFAQATAARVESTRAVADWFAHSGRGDLMGQLGLGAVAAMGDTYMELRRQYKAGLALTLPCSVPRAVRPERISAPRLDEDIAGRLVDGASRSVTLAGRALTAGDAADTEREV